MRAALMREREREHVMQHNKNIVERKVAATAHRAFKKLASHEYIDSLESPAQTRLYLVATEKKHRNLANTSHAYGGECLFHFSCQCAISGLSCMSKSKFRLFGVMQLLKSTLGCTVASRNSGKVWTYEG